MSEWQPIETAPENVSRCLLWCADLMIDYDTGKKVPNGVCFGRRCEGHTYGEGRSGDWKYSHWMPLPPPPQGSQQG